MSLQQCSNTASRCKKFLTFNGWKYDAIGAGGIGAYIKDDLIAVEFGANEIILLGDTGDFLHLPMNYYALVGALIEYRQLPMNYRNT